MEKDVLVMDVEALKTPSGSTRYVLSDEHGNEYTTFTEAIARAALAAAGRRARIQFHELERDGSRNVYLDAVHVLDDGDGGTGVRADVAAWRAALAAAPWLLGSPEPVRAVSPNELFRSLKAFKDLVAADIREHQRLNDVG